jgi:hypothetical protein
MSPNLSRNVRLYVSRHDGKIEIAEVNCADGAHFLAFTEPDFFACGSANSIGQAWIIRDKAAEECQIGAHYFHLPNGVMTDEKRKDIVERVEKAYQEEAHVGHERL